MAGGIVLHAIDSIAIRVDDEPWAWGEANRDEVQRHWAELTSRSPFLFNGTVLLLSTWTIENGSFRGTCRRTDYASFMTWRDLGRPDGSRNFFALAALESADGAFLLGEMGRNTANAGRIYFPSGTPDEADIRDGMVDLAGSVLRELEEETGLAPDSVSVDPSWTVVEDGPRFAFMQRARSPLPTTALLERIEAFLAADPDPELARMHVVATPGHGDHPAMPPFQQAYLRHVLGRDQRTG